MSFGSVARKRDPEGEISMQAVYWEQQVRGRLTRNAAAMELSCPVASFEAKKPDPCILALTTHQLQTTPGEGAEPWVKKLAQTKGDS